MSFSEANLVKKLADLNNSTQSIQTLSLWLIHHRKHSKAIVDTWAQEVANARPNRKLTFLYLANDVVQNSKKKGPEFQRDFKTVLPESYKQVSKDANEKTKGSMDRMLKIWQERNIFDKTFIGQMRQDLAKKDTAASEPPKKKKKELTLIEEVEADLVATTESAPSDVPEVSGRKKKKKTLYEPSPIEAPKPLPVSSEQLQKHTEELVKALEELEHSASCDAAVRERIAALPPEVSDVSLLDKLKGRSEGEKLSSQVEDARLLLTEYNGRLSTELEERRRVAKLLRLFITAQKEALTDAETKLQEYKTKLKKVSSVRKELKSHLQSLPDLTLLPDVTGGLPPLPSAGDLFKAERDF